MTGAAALEGVFMPGHDLFPPLEPFSSGRLRVSPLHEIYWEQSGKPDGKPILFLHGGPGAGASPDHRRFFDPAAYRIIIFDQRGAGRSTPLGEIRENTTQDVIADIESLRELLDIERWHVFGGSWARLWPLPMPSTPFARFRAYPARHLLVSAQGDRVVSLWLEAFFPV